MPRTQNPSSLNRLQLKTLTLLQELAKDSEIAADDGEGGRRILHLPHPHGDHFHVGAYVAHSRDASGFTNQSVWLALERKGLARSGFPYTITLTAAGLAYETGLRDEILLGGHP